MIAATNTNRIIDQIYDGDLRIFEETFGKTEQTETFADMMDMQALLHDGMPASLLGYYIEYCNLSTNYRSIVGREFFRAGAIFLLHLLQELKEEEKG